MEFSRHTYVDIRQSWRLLLNTVIFKELAFSQYIFVQQAEEIQMKTYSIVNQRFSLTILRWFYFEFRNWGDLKSRVLFEKCPCWFSFEFRNEEGASKILVENGLVDFTLNLEIKEETNVTDFPWNCREKKQDPNT